MSAYMEVECFYCHKPFRFKKSQIENQKERSYQFYHKKCFKKIMEVYAKQGRVVEETKPFEIVSS
jgi:cytochrome c556